MKAYPSQRIIAYIIDFAILNVIVLCVTMFIPMSKNMQNLLEEQNTVSSSYLKQEIEVQEYLNRVAEIDYDIAYEGVISTIVQIVIIILYFVVFQFYNNGQTIGKKIMKVRVVRDDGKKLLMNDILFRSLLINTILFSILDLGFVLFVGKGYYVYFSLGLQMLMFAFIVATVIMVFVRHDHKGLHDMVAHTSVIVDGAKEMEVCEN